MTVCAARALKAFSKVTLLDGIRGGAEAIERALYSVS